MCYEHSCERVLNNMHTLHTYAYYEREVKKIYQTSYLEDLEFLMSVYPEPAVELLGPRPFARFATLKRLRNLIAHPFVPRLPKKRSCAEASSRDTKRQRTSNPEKTVESLKDREAALAQREGAILAREKVLAEREAKLKAAEESALRERALSSMRSILARNKL